MSGGLVADFLGRTGRRIFVVHHRPPTQSGTCVIVAPPFAEEMNKCRRMVTLLAERLTRNGMAVLVPDLFGTGDSDGEFDQAHWDDWIDDLLMAAAWSEEAGWRVDGMLAIRLGSLLGAAWLRRWPRSLASVALWQPVDDGERFVTQFLRLRVAASRMSDGGGETVGGLRRRLSAGETVEVAGYPLSAALAQRLDALRLTPMLDVFSGASCFELVRHVAESESAGLSRLKRDANAAGIQLDWRQVRGEPFWTATEIVTIPELLELTAASLGCGV